MRTALTLVLLYFCLISARLTHAADEYEVRLRGDALKQKKSTSPYTLFFEPQKNGVSLENQRIDYDLTKETELRLGPFILDESQVSMQMTREQGEFFEVEFGFETVKKYGPIYVLSFRWPTEFLQEGVLEIINDRAESLWQKTMTKKELDDWQSVLNGQVENKALQKVKNDSKEIKEKLNISRPQNLSKLHLRTQYGLAHKGFYEIPIAQISEAFRFCLSSDKYGSRLALCSRRYKFVREGGQYVIQKVNKEITPTVLINDKPVTLKGSAIFLETKVPIKLSAILKSGVYFEFVSHPKDVRMMDMVQNNETQKVEVIGYGDAPVSEVTESFYADNVYWGFLNFMPTIGDLRKFWRSEFSIGAPYLYLKGQGGAPFRQNFEYEDLPTVKARIELSDKTTKSTYDSHVWVTGKVDPEIKVDADDAQVKRLSDNEFKWEFPAPEPGVYNKSFLNVYEKDKKWKAAYEIYRGFPAEFGLRMTGILTNNFTLILMAEAAGQYWFEDIFGWDNYTYSKQRWGVSAKYFEAIKGTKNSLSKLAAGNFDIKYRFTPGIWGRDPTVGLIASALNLDYGFKDDLGRVAFSVPVVGGGMFWARSMPRVFDDFFNLVPFMRYPKWVDWEVVAYPLTLREKQRSNYMFTMNFHGKIQWTQYFYGEGGFGVKNLSFSDYHFGDPNKQLNPKLGILYSQVGLGFNF